MFCPPCRVCRMDDNVLVYPDDFSLTICPSCCDKVEEHPDGEKGHQWDHDPGDRTHVCRYCGIDIKCTEYAESFYERD